MTSVTTTIRWSRTARMLTAAGVALVPWMVALTRVGGPHPVVWIGLDAMEAAGLIATGVALARGDRRRIATASATTMLLVTDAWFDVLTAAPGLERTVATLMAAGVELPLAAVCAAVAWQALRALTAPPFPPAHP
jgi:hypothetical protein